MDGPPSSSSHGSVAADVSEQGETSGRQSATPSLRTLNPKLEEIHKEVESDRKEMHNVQLEIQKTEIDDLNHKLTEAKRVNSQLVSQNKFLQKDLDRTKGDLEKVNLDLEECKSRLSRRMSNALTESNTQIADLSDSNRPSKLGEKHSELYDNEWTDAFEELVKKYETDESAIKTLLAILKDVHKFCEVKSAEQSKQLWQVACMWNEELERESITPGLQKQIKEFRKYTAELGVQTVCKDYLQTKQTKHPELLSNSNICKYIDGCVKLCWLMNAHDPPVVFADAAAPNTDFSTVLYKPYTCSGSHIGYVVWPALLLHPGGAILARGIAQGYSVRSNSQKESLHTKKGSDGCHYSEAEVTHDTNRKSVAVKEAHEPGKETTDPNSSIPKSSKIGGDHEHE